MVNKNGLEYYEVGGAPRDYIMGREPNDYDYVVVGESPEEMKKRGFKPVLGADFPVFLDKDSVPEGEQGDEYALARTERKSNTESDNPYHNFEVKIGEDISLKQDLKRRDFTINSIARDPKTGEIIDPYNGREDIEQGVIRHVSEAFVEDPLRVIRMARFAARFDFEVCEETMCLARETVEKIEDLPDERILREFYKAMKQADNPGKFFRVCYEANVFDHFMTEVNEMAEIPAGSDKYHKEGSVFEHSIMVVNELHKIRGNNFRELLGAFFHDIGKVRSYDKNDETYYGHDKEGAKMIENMFDRFSGKRNDVVKVIKCACQEHMRIKNLPEMNPSGVVEIARKYDVESTYNSADYLIALARADSLGREPSKDIDTTLMREKIIAARLALDIVDGDYLMSKHEEFEEWEGTKKGAVVKSDRCNEYNKLRKIVQTRWFKGV